MLRFVDKSESMNRDDHLECVRKKKKRKKEKLESSKTMKIEVNSCFIESCDNLLAELDEEEIVRILIASVRIARNMVA